MFHDHSSFTLIVINFIIYSVLLMLTKVVIFDAMHDA